MRVVNSLTQRGVLEILEAERLDPATYEESLQFAKRPRTLKELATVVFPKELPPAGQITASRFQELVDEWLATGLASDGSESPAQKDLSKTSVAIKAVESCTKRNQLELDIVSIKYVQIIRHPVPRISSIDERPDRH